MEELKALGLVLLAMLLGAAVGFEREKAHKPAGLRTHMLVSGASAFFTYLSFAVTAQMAGAVTSENVSADPTRVILAIVTGISFIGAGTVIRQRNEQEGGNVVGLTTAASLLMASAIGVGVALELYILSVGTVIFSVVMLRVLLVAESRLISKGG